MGIDYRAVIILGYPYEDVKDKIESIMEETEFDGDVYEWIEENDMEYVGPYYDCPLEESLIGIIVKSTFSYQWKEFNYDITNYPKQTEPLVKLFGIMPKLYLTPQGY